MWTVDVLKATCSLEIHRRQLGPDFIKITSNQSSWVWFSLFDCQLISGVNLYKLSVYLSGYIAHPKIPITWSNYWDPFLNFCIISIVNSVIPFNSQRFSHPRCRLSILTFSQHIRNLLLFFHRFHGFRYNLTSWTNPADSFLQFWKKKKKITTESSFKIS